MNIITWTISYNRDDENGLPPFIYQSTCSVPEMVGFLIESAIKDKNRVGIITLSRKDDVIGDLQMEQI